MHHRNVVLRHSCCLLGGLLFFNQAGLAQTPGCTDPLALNYNAAATQNDGSCQYASAVISPVFSYKLPETLLESSGLILWNGLAWTHNDNQDTALYAFQPQNGSGLEIHPLAGVRNTDWEDISKDSQYVYIGDFGNNANGNRSDLKILRIEKNALHQGQPAIDTIFFKYALQTDFSGTGPNNTDFDCEAFVVSRDSIYLFTKEWVSRQSTLYALPKTPGSYTATPQAKYNVQGLITGATYLEDKRLVALCGYSPLLQPFLYLLYDFQGKDFFSGNKRKLNIGLSFHQMEGIGTEDGLTYYLTNEKFEQSVIKVNQQCHRFDLGSYLSAYLQTNTVETPAGTAPFSLRYRAPYLYLEVGERLAGTRFRVLDMRGAVVRTGVLEGPGCVLEVSALPAGAYVVSLEGYSTKGRTFIKH